MPVWDDSNALAFFRLQRQLWTAKRATPRRVSDLAPGERARVEGTVAAAGDLLEAPFTKTPCVFWSTRVEQKHYVEGQGSWGGSTHVVWRDSFRDASGSPFLLLDDGGARLLVDLTTPFVPRMNLAHVSEHPHVNDENPSFAVYMRRNGVPTTAFMGITGDTRFYEGGLAPGARVAVFGTVFESTGVASGGYRDVPTRILALRGTDKAPLLFSG